MKEEAIGMVRYLIIDLPLRRQVQEFPQEVSDPETTPSAAPLNFGQVRYVPADEVPEELEVVILNTHDIVDHLERTCNTLTGITFDDDLVLNLVSDMLEGANPEREAERFVKILETVDWVEAFPADAQAAGAAVTLAARAIWQQIAQLSETSTCPTDYRYHQLLGKDVVLVKDKVCKTDQPL